MKCPDCGTRASDESRFCTRCGRKLSHDERDPAASATLISDSLRRMMPREYVEQLLAARGGIAGERRVITILFFDVKGSTAMAEDLDPEDVMEIMNGAFEVLVGPVFRYGGTVARLMGDGMLCFFGAPIAHEDDPERACRCALEILAEASRYAADLERTRGIRGFDVRVGINTGLVVVGEVGADLRVEYTAMGDAVNLAARMEGLAEPGTALITETTQRRIGDALQTESLGPMQIRGRKEPVGVFRVLGTRRRDGSTNRSESLYSPLVGREAEISKLQSTLWALKEVRGSTVAIVGDGGIGKSRLVSEVRRAPAAAEAAWFGGRGLAYTAGVSYSVVREVMHCMLGVDPEAKPADVSKALHAEIARLAGVRRAIKPGGSGFARDADPVAMRPYLSLLLDLPDEEAGEARGSAPSPEALQRHIWRAFQQFIALRSTERPLVLVLEDMHWADPSSLGLLEATIPLCRDLPVFLLLLFRRNEGRVWEAHQRLQGTHANLYHVIDLAPLTREQSQQVLGNLLEVHGMSPQLRDMLLDRAEGNAFFLEELIRTLVDTGIIVQEGHKAVVAACIESIDIPETLQGAILARLDRLRPQDKRTLQTASVIGRVFPQEVLARLVRGRLSGERLRESLTALHHREFVHPWLGEVGDSHGTSVALGPAMQATEIADREYAFKHAITADVTYESLLKRHRRELHGHAGEAIEALYPERLDEIAPTLAYHFERAARDAKAIHYYLRSGQRAAGLCSNQEAIDHYLQAIRLAERAQASDAVPAPVSEDWLLKGNEGAGDVCYRMSEYARAVAHYDKGLALVRFDRQAATLHRKRGEVFEKWGRYDESKQCFDSALEAMCEDYDAAEAARIYSGLSLVHYHRGDLEPAVELGVVALESMEELGDRTGIAQACNNLGIFYGKRGEGEQSLQYHLRGLAIRHELDDMYGLAMTYNNLGLASRQLGRLLEAIAHHRRSLDMFTKLGNEHGIARTYDNLSETYLELGDEEQSQECLKKAVTILGRISAAGSDVHSEMWQSGAW